MKMTCTTTPHLTDPSRDLQSGIGSVELTCMANAVGYSPVLVVAFMIATKTKGKVV